MNGKSSAGSRLEALQEILLAINSTLDVEEVLGLILEQASQLLGTQNGSIMLLDEAGEELSILVARGLREEIVRTTRVRLGEGIAGRVALEGRPRVLPRGVRAANSHGEATEIPAAAVVPLRTRERVIGVLNVSNKADGSDFTDDEVELLTVLASQSAVALENARLHARTEAQRRELAALYEIGMAINSSLDPEEVLQAVLDKAIQLLDAQQGSLMLRDPARDTLFIAAAHGLPEEVVRTVRVPLGEGIAGQVAQSGKPRRLLQGVREADSQTDGQRGARAALSVPLVRQGEVLGVLNVSGRWDEEDFSEANLQLLSTLAAQAAVAISNAQLYRQARSWVSALHALNRIGTSLTSSLDRDAVLRQVLERALDLLQVRSGSLMLIAEGEEEEKAAAQEMRIVVAQGLPEEVVRTARVPVGQGIAGSVAARGEPLILRRGVRDERSQSDQARAAQAALCVPLRVKDRVIGVLNLSERYDGEDFTEEHLELTQTLASQAAVAIENSQLHGDLREMFFGTISTVANAIDARDPYTRGHSERVTQYALLIAREVGFPKAEREALQIAALLHDVGKIAIEDEILRKPGKLTDEEYAKMKLHPGKVADILAPVKQLRKMVPYMKYHHEQYTAQGYPEGLHRENIPLAARIIAVADAYDAMTSDRPYRQGMPRAVALERLHEAKERQLDPRLVEAFARVVARGEIDPIDGQGMRDER